VNDTIPIPTADTLPCPGSIPPEWQRAKDETLAALVAVSGSEFRAQLSVDLDQVVPEAQATYSFLLEKVEGISARERHYCLATALLVRYSLLNPRAQELIPDAEKIIDHYLDRVN
jgi:hypothetical protein